MLRTIIKKSFLIGLLVATQSQAMQMSSGGWGQTMTLTAGGYTMEMSPNGIMYMGPKRSFLSRHKWLIGGTLAAAGALYYGYRNSDAIKEYLWSHFAPEVDNNVRNTNSWKCEQKREEFYTIADNAGIDLTNTIGKINVASTDGYHVKLLIHKRGATQNDLDLVDADITHAPEVISILTKYRNPQAQALIDYTLCVPRCKTTFLTLTNSTGDITVQDVNASVRTKTATGSQKLRQIAHNATIESVTGDVVVQSVGKDCSITSTTGKITAQDILAQLDCVSRNGDITAQEVNGDVTARATNGKIKVFNIAGNVTAHATNGDISIKNKGAIEARSTNGRISVEKDILNVPVTIETTHGDIKINASAIHAHLLAKTKLGDIDSDFPIQKVGQKNVNCSMGNGGHQVKLSTTHGDIKLNKIASAQIRTAVVANSYLREAMPDILHPVNDITSVLVKNTTGGTVNFVTSDRADIKVNLEREGTNAQRSNVNWSLECGPDTFHILTVDIKRENAAVGGQVDCTIELPKGRQFNQWRETTDSNQ